MRSTGSHKGRGRNYRLQTPPKCTTQSDRNGAETIRHWHARRFCDCRQKSADVLHRIIACSAFSMDPTGYDDVRPIVISVMIILNIILNVIAIAVIVKYPQLREDRTTLFMFSLTLSDLANGCLALPMSAAQCSSWTPNVRSDTTYFPKIHAAFSVWFTVTSTHSLCWVTVCKMLAITNPFRYEQILTRNRCYIIICVIWLIGAAMSATMARFASTWDSDACIYRVVISKDNVAVMFVVAMIVLVVPVVGLVYSTTRIFRAILRAHRQISAQANSIGGGTENVAGMPSSTLKSIRSGRNVLIVCLALVVLTIPYVIFILVRILRQDYAFPSWVIFILTWIMISNTFINSLIYLVVFRSVRAKTAEMFRAVCESCTFL